jgi:hypothetical protein
MGYNEVKFEKRRNDMLNKISQMNPQTIRNIKIGAAVVGAVAIATVVGVALYKAGYIGQGAEVIEEIVETAASTAA